MRARLTIAAALGAALVAVAPAASALAVDRFVDNETGSDLANVCLSSANPCASVGHALTQANAADTIRVDDSPVAYQPFEISAATSVAGSDFVAGDEGAVVVDGGVQVAVDVLAGGGGATISGLTIRSSGVVALRVADGATVNANLFDSVGAGDDIRVVNASPTITDNDFTDSSTALADVGVRANGGSPTIADNTFSGLARAIVLGDTTGVVNAQIKRNTITGVHPANFTQGSGVEANGSTLILEDNRISAPAATETTGVIVTASGGTASGTLRRNQVYDHGTGVLFNNTTAASMNGDVIAGSLDIGMVGFDDPGGIEGANVIAKNVTIADASPFATRDVLLSDAALALDSSIIGDDGIDVGISNGTCVITSSRGPTSTPGPSGCGGFQVTTPPNFVSPAANDYRLTADNQDLIDAGDPAAPAAPDALDFEGQKRAIDGDGDCSQLRDIGADEYLPPAPTASVGAGPPNGTTLTTGTTQFEFTSSYACAPAFECSLDGQAFAACTSPKALASLAEGAHTFSVRAVDLVPQAGPVATRSFSVDLPNPPVKKPKCKKPKKKKGKKKKRKKCRK
jgi:hypothetical protein